jgi:enediyne biosynthesis protein E4
VPGRFVGRETESSPREMTRLRMLGLLLGACMLPLLSGLWITHAAAQMASSRPLTSVEPRGGAPVANFVDIGEAAGLTAKTVIGGSTQKNAILETTGAGVAIFDYDNDGWPDIFLVNGSQEGSGSALSKPTSHLYHNNHDGTFTDVTDKAGLTRQGWGQGVCVGDYDGDGYLDLFVTYYGKNVLYHNNGDGTFTDVTEHSGLLTKQPLYSSGAAFIDYDRDGHLDLFVSHYVDYDQARSHDDAHGSACKWRGTPVLCGPRGLKGAANTLYRNNSDGTFTDVSEKAGILVGQQYGFTPLTLDYDNDGWEDIYVANDSTPSLLFHNNHDGTFKEVGVLAGVAYNEDGREQSGMGAAAGDYDGDGALDIFKTNFEEDTSSLYHNRKDGTFDDVTFPAGVGVNTRYVGWGTGFIDFDNDGWPDLFLANGHVYPEVDKALKDATFRERKILYRNRGNGTFEDVSLRTGPGILLPRVSRGVAFGDLFNSGQVDIVINNMNDVPTLLHNTAPQRNHAVSVQLVGKAPNSFAIGARVVVRTKERQMVDEVRSGGSYLSQNDLRLHFGLGAATEITKMEIRWPDGHQDTLTNLPADRRLVIRYGGRIESTQVFLPMPHPMQPTPAQAAEPKGEKKIRH